MQRNANSGGEQSSLSGRIYEAIKAEIISHQFSPGTMLLEKQLADRFEVSRTPVREALRRLEQDGLARIIAHKGAFITEVSLRDTFEIDEIRLLLEGAAARKAALNISIDALDEIEASLSAVRNTSPSRSDYQAVHEIDQRLHDEILEAAGNYWLRETVLKLYNIIHRIRGIDSEKRHVETLAELEVLIAALKARDADAAEKAMREHIANARLFVHIFR